MKIVPGMSVMIHAGKALCLQSMEIRFRFIE